MNPGRCYCQGLGIGEEDGTWISRFMACPVGQANISIRNGWGEILKGKYFVNHWVLEYCQDFIFIIKTLDIYTGSHQNPKRFTPSPPYLYWNVTSQWGFPWWPYLKSLPCTCPTHFLCPFSVVSFLLLLTTGQYTLPLLVPLLVSLPLALEGWNLQFLEQCLAYSGCSVNTYWKNGENMFLISNFGQWIQMQNLSFIHNLQLIFQRKGLSLKSHFMYPQPPWLPEYQVGICPYKM